MKLAVRIFALTVVVAGAAAASFSSSNSKIISSQAVSATLPMPTCGPNLPTCPTQPGPSVR